MTNNYLNPDQNKQKETKETVVDWCLQKGKEAKFQNIMEIVWKFSMEEMLQLMKCEKIFTNKIHEELAETVGFITDIVKGSDKRMRVSVGEVFDKIKTEIPTEKERLIELARLLYSAKLFEVVNNKKQTK
jgi:hypothetical protein